MAAQRASPGDAHLDHPALPGQAGQPGRRGRRVGRALGHLGGGQRPQAAQQVGHGLLVPAGPARRQPLQFALGLLDDQRVEQLAHVGLAEQVGQQRRVQRQRLGAPLGQRRVALVHERADVAEQQRPAERRRRRASRPRPAGRAGRTGRASAGSGPARRTRPGGTRAPSPARSGTSSTGWPPTAAEPSAAAAATAACGGRAGGGAAAARGPRTRGTGRRTAPRSPARRSPAARPPRGRAWRCRPAAGRRRRAPGSRCRRRCDTACTSIPP